MWVRPSLGFSCCFFGLPTKRRKTYKHIHTHTHAVYRATSEYEHFNVFSSLSQSMPPVSPPNTSLTFRFIFFWLLRLSSNRSNHFHSLSFNLRAFVHFIWFSRTTVTPCTRLISSFHNYPYRTHINSCYFGPSKLMLLILEVNYFGQSFSECHFSILIYAISGHVFTALIVHTPTVTHAHMSFACECVGETSTRKYGTNGVWPFFSVVIVVAVTSVIVTHTH